MKKTKSLYAIIGLLLVIALLSSALALLYMYVEQQHFMTVEAVGEIEVQPPSLDWGTFANNENKTYGETESSYVKNTGTIPVNVTWEIPTANWLYEADGDYYGIICVAYMKDTKTIWLLNVEYSRDKVSWIQWLPLMKVESNFVEPLYVRLNLIEWEAQPIPYAFTLRFNATDGA